MRPAATCVSRRHVAFHSIVRTNTPLNRHLPLPKDETALANGSAKMSKCSINSVGVCVSKVRVPNRDPCFPASPFFVARVGCKLKKGAFCQAHHRTDTPEPDTYMHTHTHFRRSHTFADLARAAEARTSTWQVAGTYGFAKQSRNLTMGPWEKLVFTLAENHATEHNRLLGHLFPPNYPDCFGGCQIQLLDSRYRFLGHSVILFRHALLE